MGSSRGEYGKWKVAWQGQGQAKNHEQKRKKK